MDERIVIFGGNDSLEKGLRRIAQGNPKAVFVVTTCASGIIGDDVHVAIGAAREAWMRVSL
jgi:nitrogenase molybdenum-iron protein alpha chain